MRAGTTSAKADQSVERMGASGSGQLQFLRHRRLAPTAHAHRYTRQRLPHDTFSGMVEL